MERAHNSSKLGKRIRTGKRIRVGAVRAGNLVFVVAEFGALDVGAKATAKARRATIATQSKPAPVHVNLRILAFDQCVRLAHACDLQVIYQCAQKDSFLGPYMTPAFASLHLWVLK